MSDGGDDENDFYIPPMFLHGISAAFLGTYAIYYATKVVLIPRFATQSFRDKIDQLVTLKDKKNFYTTFQSMAHALVQSCFHPMLISLGYSPEHSANRVTYFDDGWPAFFSGIFVGYLLADTMIIGPIDLGPMYCLHHLSAIVIWTWTACVGAMQWYASMLQFAEFSTIFLNGRQWVLTAGYSSDSRVVVGVSMAFFVAFFVVRVVPLPWLVYLWLTNDLAQLSDEKGLPVALASTSTLIIHVLLQSFWFLLMVNKIDKTIKRSKSSVDII